MSLMMIWLIETVEGAVADERGSTATVTFTSVTLSTSMTNFREDSEDALSLAASSVVLSEDFLTLPRILLTLLPPSL